VLIPKVVHPTFDFLPFHIGEGNFDLLVSTCNIILNIIDIDENLSFPFLEILLVSSEHRQFFEKRLLPSHLISYFTLQTQLLFSEE
jgi:hypothetical protein